MDRQRQILSTGVGVLREIHKNIVENARQGKVSDLVLPSRRTLALSIINEDTLLTFADVEVFNEYLEL